MIGAVLGFVLLFVRPAKPLKLPPGPKGLPVLGNLLQMGTHPHRVIAKMQKKYGHIIHIRLGSSSTIVIDGPNLIAQITKEQDHVFSSRPLMTFTKIVGYDHHGFAMAPYGAYWRHARRICVHELLTPKRLEATAKERKEESSCMIGFVCEAAQSGKVIDLRDVFSGLSMNVMCRMLLGRREFYASGTKVKDFKHVIHETFRLMGALNLRDFVPALGWLDIQGFERDMRKVRCKQVVMFRVLQVYIFLHVNKQAKRNKQFRLLERNNLQASRSNAHLLALLEALQSLPPLGCFIRNQVQTPYGKRLDLNKKSYVLYCN